MKNFFLIIFTFFILNSCNKSEQRTYNAVFNQKQTEVDTSYVSSVTIDSAILCYTTLTDLRNRGFQLKPFKKEQNNLLKEYSSVGEAYYTDQAKGLIIGTYDTSELITTLWLTDNFKGSLIGKHVNMKTYTVKDMLADYPDFKWSTTDASSYWYYTNNYSTVFYLKVNPSIPKFPLNESHYLDKNIEAVKTELYCGRIYGPDFGAGDTVYIKPLYAPLSNTHTNYYLQYRKPGISTTLTEITSTGKKTILEQKKIGKWLIYNPDHSLQAVEYYNNGVLSKINKRPPTTE